MSEANRNDAETRGFCPLGHEPHGEKITRSAYETADQAEAWFYSLLDTAADGIIVTDDSGRILAFNKACEDLFGYSAEEITGEGISKIMPHSEAVHHGQHIARYLETGKKRIIGIGRDLEARHRDGTEFPIELSVGEANTNTGRQFIGIIRDTRSRKKAEARHRQLQGELEHLARVSAMNELGSAIAHELNQPLTAIMLYMQAATRAASKSGLDENIREILEKAANEAERAGKILRGMRRFVEKREVERRKVAIHEVIHEAIDLMAQTLVERAIDVQLSFTEGEPMVDADPVQIQQILINLMRNAMNAIGDQEDRRIRVETHVKDGTLELGVEDNGPGLGDEVMPTLFRAFSSSGVGGMGLGLAISRSIARRHEGDLALGEATRLGGARFDLTLPLAEGAE